MPEPGLATAADYSEALLTVRRSKSLLCLILALFLAGQVATFLLCRYGVVSVSPSSATPAADVPSTLPTLMTPPASPVAGGSTRLVDALHYLTGVMVLGGIALSIVLAASLCLIGHIMLVGRLIGVGRVVGALVWAFVLIVLLFPWQFFMNNAGLTVTDFRVPGVLWTWDEMVSRYQFVSSLSGDHWADTVLSWFRFVGAPAVALILVLVIQVKSNRGLRMALGEDELLNRMLGQEA